MDTVKCLSIYALVEICNGNKNFEEYTTRDFVINDITLAEFYYALLQKHDEEKADYWFKKLEQYSFRVSKEILAEAVKFRNKNKTKKISFFDVVSYMFSVKNNIPFVTGDKEFEKMPGVEFKR